MPVLNELYRRPRRSESGVRALILYPMNALVNDQVERLETWLEGQSRATFFYLTSETPEDRRAAVRDGVSETGPHRFRTREQARGREDCDGAKLKISDRGPVPDVLITNYSMLEYMLCRPQDAVFFGPALEAIVLDEAHLYAGTLAAEITLLLRRVLLRCQRTPEQIIQIATSATLGGDNEDLIEFTSRMFSIAPECVHAIKGRPADLEMLEERPPDSELDIQSIADASLLANGTIKIHHGKSELRQNAFECHELVAALKTVVADDVVDDALQSSGDVPARLLRSTLAHSPIVHLMAKVLCRGTAISLRELTSLVWDSTDSNALQATMNLLRLAASARNQPDELPLLPHRLHLQVRSPRGLAVCLFPSCNGPKETRLPPLGSVQIHGPEQCRHCESPTYPVVRCDNCGQWAIAGRVDESTAQLQPTVHKPFEALVPFDHVDHPPDDSTEYVINPSTGELRGAGSAGCRLLAISACLRCGERLKEFHYFGTGDSLTLAITAETVLAELPALSSDSKAWCPARGRRLLIFSDSRQAAARLGPRLTSQHETQMIRAAVARTAQDDSGLEALDGIRADIAEEEDKLKAATTGAESRRRIKRLKDLKRELTSVESGGSIEEWSERLSGLPEIAELMDPEESDKQPARESWSQQDWDKNCAVVTGHLRYPLAAELARRPAKAQGTLEATGLIEVVYPGIARIESDDRVMGVLPSEAARTALTESWPQLLTLLCDTLRMDGCITLGDRDHDRDFGTSRAPVGRWMSCHENTDNGWLQRFIGSIPRQRRRRFVADILRRADIESDRADALSCDVLQMVFDRLVETAKLESFSWLSTETRETDTGQAVPAIRLNFLDLALRSPLHLYRCDKTGTIWTNSAYGCVPRTGCDQVTEVAFGDDGDPLADDPRVGRARNDYRDRVVFRMGLWAEEHSAQLSPKENWRLQNLFLAGARNVLSCTTTMELGIDIGGLAAAMMSNVPPGKANYLQRAGRAGRRADGSSAVITFCHDRPFDRAVFTDFGQYLSRPLRKPQVLLDRERLAWRHLASWLLGGFFHQVYGPEERKGAMDAFGRMGAFCRVERPDYWEPKQSVKPRLQRESMAELPGKPWRAAADTIADAFLDYLRWTRDFGGPPHDGAQRLLQTTPLTDRVANDWSVLIREVERQFEEAVNDWRGDYDELLASWKETVPSDDNGSLRANAIRYQLNSFYHTTVIEALSDRQFLPRYGFPVNVHRLKVLESKKYGRKDESRVREEDQFRLERGGLLAIREYVPGATLMAGGKFIQSRGLNRSAAATGNSESFGLRAIARRCKSGHMCFQLTGRIPDECDRCRAPWKTSLQVLLPRFGFSTAAWDPPRRTGKIDTAYGQSELDVLWEASGSEQELQRENYGGVAGLTARYRDDGIIVVLNHGRDRRGFIICTRCGYSESEASDATTASAPRKRFDGHAPLWSPYQGKEHRCLDKAGTPLRLQILGSRERTDMLRLDFDNVNIDATDKRLMTTLQLALHRAAAETLQLDSRELGAELIPSAASCFAIVLYDNAPGGAGHVRQLLDDDEALFCQSRKILHGTDDHHARCKEACLDCLLAFDTQSAHEKGLIDRCDALRWFDSCLVDEPHG